MFLLGSAHNFLQQIKDWEEEYPNEIDEVPEQAGNLDAIGVTNRILTPDAGQRSPNNKNHDCSANDVQGMQTGQGEINRGISVVPRTVVADVFDVGNMDFDFLMFATGEDTALHQLGM